MALFDQEAVPCKDPVKVPMKDPDIGFKSCLLFI
jgi:hypothetical protein